jgi:hypothetical protein
MRFAGIWLAENYLRAAGVAAVWIGATGHVGSQDVASIAVERALLGTKRLLDLLNS